MLLFSARQHNSSTVTPNTSASRYANISEGLYCSFSMEMIVRLGKPCGGAQLFQFCFHAFLRM